MLGPGGSRSLCEAEAAAAKSTAAADCFKDFDDQGIGMGAGPFKSDMRDQQIPRPLAAADPLVTYTLLKAFQQRRNS